VAGSLSGRSSRSTPSVLVAGLCVVDLVQRVTRPPGPDEKVTALSRELVAGGPATNAAVTVTVLGGSARLLTAVGSGGLASLVRADLNRPRLTLVDLAAADAGFVPNVSSAVVVDGTGERSVVSLDAAQLDQAAAVTTVLAALADADHADAALDVVLLDGHYPTVAMEVAAWARIRGIPVVLDAGRWKPHFADLLPLVDELVASAAFAVPGTERFGDLAAHGHEAGASVVAQTHGAGAIDISVEGRRSQVVVPVVEAVDSLGAGDVLHGAYAYHRADGLEPREAIARAAEAASFRCRFVGARTWTGVWPDR
jgi:sugar/nucleoside kinase (ribokinase family)